MEERKAARDTAFRVLGDGYRRRLLHLLYEADPGERLEVAPSDLAVEEDDVDAVTARLYHVHLPKLADAGYLGWDGGDLVVWRGPRFEEVAPVVEALVAHGDGLLGDGQ